MISEVELQENTRDLGAMDYARHWQSWADQRMQFSRNQVIRGADKSGPTIIVRDALQLVHDTEVAIYWDQTVRFGYSETAKSAGRAIFGSSRTVGPDAEISQQQIEAAKEWLRIAKRHIAPGDIAKVIC